MATLVGPKDGKLVFLTSIGVRFMLGSAESGGGFSLVEHPMSARALAAPMHLHTREDEYSFVIEGRVGALLGDEVLEGGPGDLIVKPRNQWHTFWNAGDTTARILEIISPGGFEKYFEEVAELVASSGFDPAQMGEISQRYGLQVRPETVPDLLERFQLVMGKPVS
jgi:mannose-6-phosphate isomerase-like protein (cupin superfamily)